MDWLTFTAEMFKAAAWPAAAVGIALMFRPQLRALLTRLNRGRLGPAEFEFEQTLQVLAARAPATGTPRASASAVARTAVPARETIAAAWRDLEQAVRARVQAAPRLPALLAQDVALYEQLEALQEKARQQLQFQPSAQAVDDYVRLARDLQARMRGAPAGPPAPG